MFLMESKNDLYIMYYPFGCKKNVLKMKLKLFMIKD